MCDAACSSVRVSFAVSRERRYVSLGQHARLRFPVCLFVRSLHRFYAFAFLCCTASAVCVCACVCVAIAAAAGPITQ